MDPVLQELRATIASLEEKVAEQSQAKESARRLEQRLDEIFDAAQDGVWEWNIQTGEVLFSQKWLSSLGYEVGELAPNVSSWESLVHPEDMPRLQEVLQQHFAGATKSYQFINRLRTKSGRFRWNLDRGRVVERDVSGAPVRMVGIDINIDSIVKITEQLQQVETRNQALVDALPDIVFRVSRDLILKDAHVPKNQQSFGPLEDAIGRTLGETGLGSKYGRELQKLVENALDLQTVQSFEGSLKILGTMRHYELRVAPAGSDDAIVISHEITERVHANENRAELEAKVQQAQRLGSLGVLAGGIAHDFRNILAGILSNAELALLRLPTSSPGRESLENIKKCTLHASELTHQLLAYAGLGQFDKRVFSLSDLVAEMTELLTLAISKKAALACNLDPNLPPIEADRSQIRQVVMNLVTNASESLGDNGGKITINTRRDTSTRSSDSASRADSIVLEVSDTGCGIDAETRENIFDPFFTTKKAGRGLGMAVLHGVVTNCGGEVQIESELGKGTTVQILLPATRATVLPTPKNSSGPAPFRGYGSILVVDDDKMIREAIEIALKLQGFDVLIARNGLEALKVFRERAGSIRAVLIDMMMPGMTGSAAVAQMRQMVPDQRAVLMSAYGADETGIQFPELNSRFLKKPFELANLVDTLRDLLG